MSFVHPVGLVLGRNAACSNLSKRPFAAPFLALTFLVDLIQYPAVQRAGRRRDCHR